jgi:ureidoacrylate peracid hydrolase
VEDATMHKVAISPAALERMTRRMGKLHPFDTMAPRQTALLVIDLQNYFVKPGQQGEIPAAREIVPNINRLAAELRRRGGHVCLDPQRYPRHAGKLVDIARIPDDAGTR